jgi:membrane-anchored protein YejM (alkaline phosphatase superfamily)
MSDARSPAPAWNTPFIWGVFAVLCAWVFLPAFLRIFMLPDDPTAEQVAQLDQLQSLLGWFTFAVFGIWGVLTWLAYTHRVSVQERDRKAWLADTPYRDERRREAMLNGDPDWWKIR